MRRTLAFAIVCALLAAPAWGHTPVTLDKIKKSGKITVGYREDARPFSFVDESGQPAGFSVDLCRIIAKEVEKQLGLTNLAVEFVPVTSENRVQAVVDGKVDIECGSTTNTFSRQKLVDFTHIVFITGSSLLTTTGSGLKAASDLKGKSVAVVTGTTTEQVLDKYLEAQQIRAKVQKVKNHDEQMKMLMDGKVEAIAGDRIMLFGLAMKTSDPEKLMMTEDLFSYEPYAFMIPRGDPDFRLVANRALSRVFESGEIGTIYRKWFISMGARPSQFLVTLYQIQSLPE